MKFTFVFLILAIIANPVFAAKKIEKILEVGDLKENHFSLYMSDGEIVHVNANDKDILKKSRKALKNSSLIKLVKSSKSSETADIINDIEVVPVTPIDAEFLAPVSSNRSEAKFNFLLNDPMTNANLTKMSSYDEAQRVMDTFNGDTHKDSQCYNRAHVWTYEASVNESVNLGKVWIFFTKKYIREYNYKWWFHIAPVANVEGTTYVVDRGFTMIPYNLTNWKNIFIKSKQECTTTTNYLEYESNPQNGHCYLIFSGQHFYQPEDLKNVSTRGTYPSGYNINQVRNAYRDALNNWDGQIPGVTAEPGPGGQIFVFRVGESVVSRNGVVGQVVRLRGDELVVQYRNMRNPILQHKGEVGMRRGQVAGFSVGQFVIGRNGLQGQVIAIYMDGFLGVHYPSRRIFTLEHPSSLRIR